MHNILNEYGIKRGSIPLLITILNHLKSIQMTKEEVVLLQKNRAFLSNAVAITNQRIREIALKSDKTSIEIRVGLIDATLTRMVHDHFRSKGFTVNSDANTISWE
jgi:hypothetical protein